MSFLEIEIKDGRGCAIVVAILAGLVAANLAILYVAVKIVRMAWG